MLLRIVLIHSWVPPHVTYPHFVKCMCSSPSETSWPPLVTCPRTRWVTLFTESYCNNCIINYRKHWSALYFPSVLYPYQNDNGTIMNKRQRFRTRHKVRGNVIVCFFDGFRTSSHIWISFSVDSIGSTVSCLRFPVYMILMYDLQFTMIKFSNANTFSTILFSNFHKDYPIQPQRYNLRALRHNKERSVCLQIPPCIEQTSLSGNL